MITPALQSLSLILSPLLTMADTKQGNGFEGAQTSLQNLSKNPRFPAKGTCSDEVSNLSAILQERIHKFKQNHEILRQALEGLAKLHPILKSSAVAILPFTAVMKLYKHWRKTDHTIVLLFLEMQDMMWSLTVLPLDRLQEGVSEKLGDLCGDLSIIAKEINDCAELCDTFYKKKLVGQYLFLNQYECRWKTLQQ